LCFVVCLQVLLVIVAFFSFSGDEGSLQSLPVFLLDHDFGSRVHLLVALIEFLVLMQDDSMLVCDWENLLNALRELLLLIWVFLGRVIAHDLRTDVISKLIVKIFLIHMLSIINYSIINKDIQVFKRGRQELVITIEASIICSC
jgi:hypothetical protein